MVRKLAFHARCVVGIAVLLGLSAMGCAGDKGELNRVQPGYYKKADFLGSSWYYRRTIVDSSETNPWAIIGSGDWFTLERVRFEIQEKFLIAYRDYEYVEGSEEGTRPEGKEEGAVLAAFPITTHFDAVFEYNAATNERTNVRSENTVDRVWHEREFMRVNWSSNKAPALNTMIYAEVDNKQGGEFYVHADDLTNPYHARIQPEKGYVDVVMNHVLQPDPWSCYDMFGETGCGPGEAKVRHAFMRVDEEENKGYQGLWYPDSVPVVDNKGQEILDPKTGEIKREVIAERFGFYRLERPTYDHIRGSTLSGRQDLIVRFNLWDKSIDAQGKEIPYAQRTVRPVVYYTNWDFPEDLKETAQEIANEWNAAFKGTVASLQGKPLDQVPDVFVLRHNSCNAANLEAVMAKHDGMRDKVSDVVGHPIGESLSHWCSAVEYLTQNMPEAERFIWQQNGDLRFNMIFYINNVEESGLLGYGPMLADPTTGRIVSASSYMHGDSIESSTTRALEYLKYVYGEKDFNGSEVIFGDNVPNHYMDADHTPHSPARSVDGSPIRKIQTPLASKAHLQSLEARFKRLGDNLGGEENLLTPMESSTYYVDRLARVAGTSVERDYLLRDEDLVVASKGRWKPGMPTDSALWEEASFLARSRDARVARRKQIREIDYKTFYPAAELDDTIVGLADELKPYDDAERRIRLKRAIFRGVTLHEVGHNIGLRHNFEGSFDALNFHDTFWNVEQSGLTEEAKLRERQPEYKYSSIMDYHGRVNADFQGLGKYDHAAIKFGYGQLIETFNTNTVSSTQDLRNYQLINDYRKLPTYVGGLAAMRARVDRSFDWRKGTLTEAELATLKDKEVPYMYCSDEYAGLLPTCRRFDLGANHREIQDAAIDQYRNYFVFANYLRNRLNANWNAANRGHNVFRDTVTTYQYMYLYRAQQERLLGGQSFFDTDLGRDMATSVSAGLNLMTEVLAMPEPGNYVACKKPDSSRIGYYPNGAGAGVGATCGTSVGADAPVRLGGAQPLFLGFTDDWVEWTFSYIGTYWDKQAALAELTDPSASFFRVDVNADYRYASVSPYRIYSEEIRNVLSHVIRYDLEGFASHFDPATGTVVPRSVLNPSEPLGSVNVPTPDGSTLPVVFPSFARNLQRSAVLYGLAFLSSPLDDALDFSKYTRVTLEGSIDDFAGSENLPASSLIRCVIPASGATYRASQTRTGDSPAYEMVGQCKNYSEKWTKADAQLRAATASMTTEQRKALENTRKDAAAQLALLEQTLQYTRIVHRLYEYGVGL